MSCHEKESAVVRTRLDLASDTESSRYALSAIQVVPSDEDGKVWLTATDGRILAAVQTEGVVNQRRLMPIAVVKTTKSQRSQGLTVERNGRWEAATRNRTGVKIAVGDDVKGLGELHDRVSASDDEVVEEGPRAAGDSGHRPVEGLPVCRRRLSVAAHFEDELQRRILELRRGGRGVGAQVPNVSTHGVQPSLEFEVTGV